MNYKKNLKFKVEAKTGKLVRRFNIKLVIELNQLEVDQWLSDSRDQNKEIAKFYLFLKEVFLTAFELIIQKDSQMFEKIYSSKFNLNVTIYTKNEKESKQISKYPHINPRFKDNKIYFNPSKENLFFIYPNHDLLGYFDHYKNKRISKQEIISELKVATFHEITHVLDRLTTNSLESGLRDPSTFDIIRAEGLAVFQNAIHDPKAVIYISENNAFHKQTKKYFQYTIKNIKNDPYYFGLYMCLVMFAYFVKNRDKALYEQLYQVVFSGNPNYQILLAELDKDKTKVLAATFRQIISQQDAKTFFKKFYETAIILRLKLDCLEEIKKLF